MSSFNRRGCYGCGGPLDGLVCRRGNSFIYDSNMNSFDNPLDFSYQPPQHYVKTYSCELYGNDSHYGYDCPPRFPPIYERESSYNQNFGDNRYLQKSLSFPQQYLCCEKYVGPHESFQCQPMNQNYFEHNPSYNSNYFGFDRASLYPVDQSPPQEMSIQDMEVQKQQYFKEMQNIISQLPPSIVITTSPPVLPIEDPEDSLIMGNEELSTILENESDEVIKSSVEDLVPIPSESEDTSESDSDDDESLFDEDEYISSDANPLFDEVLEDSNFDEPVLLVTRLFNSNEDECFDPGADVDEINAFNIPSDFVDSYYDLEGDVLYLESFLSDDTTPNLPPGVFLYHDPRSLSDINDLKIMVKVFDPGILEKFFSLTYVKLPFKDRHYLSLTYVI
nr:hypothetical protein [Tanacetum cinerariifolium]